MQIRGINPGKKGNGLEKSEFSEHKASHAGLKNESEEKAPVLLPSNDRVSISASLREHTKALGDLVQKAKEQGSLSDPHHQARLDSLKAKIDQGTLLTPEVLKKTAEKILGDL